MTYCRFNFAELLHAFSFSVATLVIIGKYGNLEITYRTHPSIFLPKHLVRQLHRFLSGKKLRLMMKIQLAYAKNHLVFGRQSMYPWLHYR